MIPKRNYFLLSLLFVTVFIDASYLSRGPFSQMRKNFASKMVYNNAKRDIATGAELAIAPIVPPPVAVGAGIAMAATVPVAIVAESIAPGKVPGAKAIKDRVYKIGDAVSDFLDTVIDGESPEEAQARFEALVKESFSKINKNNVPSTIIAQGTPITLEEKAELLRISEIIKHNPHASRHIDIFKQQELNGEFTIPTAAPVSTPVPSSQFVQKAQETASVVGSGAVGTAVAGAVKTAIATKKAVVIGKGALVIGKTASTAAAAGKGVVLAKSTMVYAGGKATVVTAAASTATSTAAATTATAPGWIPWITAPLYANPVVAVPVAITGIGLTGYGVYKAYQAYNAVSVVPPVIQPAELINNLPVELRNNKPHNNKPGNFPGGPLGPKDPKKPQATSHTASPDPNDNDRIRRTDVELYEKLKEIKKNYEYDDKGGGYVLKDRGTPIQKGVEALKIDKAHWEFEAYDRRGNHMGAIDPVTGKFYKPSVLGRTYP